MTIVARVLLQSLDRFVEIQPQLIGAFVQPRLDARDEIAVRQLREAGAERGADGFEAIDLFRPFHRDRHFRLISARSYPEGSRPPQ